MHSLFQKDWNFKTLASADRISPFVLTHLKKIYLSLFFASAMMAYGAYLNLLWAIGGIMTTLVLFCSIFWLFSLLPWKEMKRFLLLMVVAFSGGASVGPLIECFLTVDKGFLVSPLVGASLPFGCFFVMAMLKQHRGSIYSVGLTTSALLILTWLHFASIIFGGYEVIQKIQLFVVLLANAAYILVFTRVKVEEARRGDLVYLRDSLTYFIDAPVVFILVISILLNKATEKFRNAADKS